MAILTADWESADRRRGPTVLPWCGWKLILVFSEGVPSCSRTYALQANTLPG